MPIKNNKISFTKFILSIIYLLLYPLVILYLSGDRHWIQGWIFGIWFITTFSITLIYLYYKDPALFAERFRFSGEKNQKIWDKYFLFALMIGYLVWFVITPLDAKRFAWTKNFPVWLEILGGIGLIASSFLLFRSFADNTFLSPLVRIQKERNQQVVSTGVYAFVRHPMYLGAILMFMAVPVLLGSVYGILTGAILSFFLVARIIGEEKMLVEELEGYIDYKKKVKYRLIPFVW